MTYEKKVTKEVIEKILSLGVKEMPRNPSVLGYNQDQIKGYFYIPEEKILELLSKVEDSVGDISDKVDGLESVIPEEYQKKTDNALETESKEIVGAINEINDGKVDKDSNEFIRKGEAVNKSDATFGLYGRLDDHEQFFIPNKWGTSITEGTIPIRSVNGTLRAETANNNDYDDVTGTYTTMHYNTLTNVKFVKDNYLNKKLAQTMSGMFYDWKSCLQLKDGSSGANVSPLYDKDAVVVLNVRDNIGRNGAHINIFNSETSFYKKKVNIGNGSSLIISDRKINDDKSETETTIYNKLSKNGNEFNVDTVFNSNASINNAPVEETHITNKKYADTTYTHAITFLNGNGSYGYIVYIQSPRPEPYTLQEIQELVVFDEYGIPAYEFYATNGTMTPTQYRGYSDFDGGEYYFGVGGGWTNYVFDEVKDTVI